MGTNIQLQYNEKAVLKFDVIEKFLLGVECSPPNRAHGLDQSRISEIGINNGILIMRSTMLAPQPTTDYLHATIRCHFSFLLILTPPHQTPIIIPYHIASALLVLTINAFWKCMFLNAFEMVFGNKIC